MKKRYRYRLKREIKEMALKIVISFVVLILDVVIYHYLGILGPLAVENDWVSAIICVGWFWLIAGQFMALYVMWE